MFCFESELIRKRIQKHHSIWVFIHFCWVFGKKMGLSLGCSDCVQDDDAKIVRRKLTYPVWLMGKCWGKSCVLPFINRFYYYFELIIKY